MSRLMSAVWIVQFWFFMALSITCLARPSALLYLLEECVVTARPALCCPESDAGGEAAPGDDYRIPHGLGREAAAGCSRGGPRGAAEGGQLASSPCGPGPCVPCTDALSGQPACVLVETDVETQGLFSLVRLWAPFFAAFAMFSLHAMMRTDERTRRNLAFIFAGILTVLGVLVYTDGLGDILAQDLVRARVFESRTLIAGLAALLLFSVYSIIRAEDGSRRAAAGLAALAYGGLLLPYFLASGAVIDPVFLGSVELGGGSYLTYRVMAVAAAVALVLDTLAGDLERTRARLFALVLIFPFVLFALDFVNVENGSNSLADEPTVVRVLLVGTVVNILLHAQYAAWPIEEREQKLSGSASTRPPALWVLWLFQGLAFVGFAALLVWAHSHDDGQDATSLFVHRNIMDRLVENGWYRSVFGDIDEIYPGLLIAMGLFSFSGMGSSREWVWKAHCFIFAAFYGAQILCITFVWSPTVLKPPLLLLLVPSAALCAVHVLYFRSHSRWFSDDVGEGPDGWVIADLALGSILLTQAAFTRRRASHASGVAAEGRMVVSGSSEIPRHDFFERRAAMDVLVRFSNERSSDDAAADARGAALCLVAADGRRFDLTLSTGAFGPARNIVEYGLIWVLSRMGEPGRALLARSRRVLEAGLAALRRAPDSYTSLWYCSQSVRFWVSSDKNERWLVRYRLSPEDPAGEESGTLVGIRDYVRRRRAKGERRPTDYLRRDLKMRLQGTRDITLKLQAQLHKVRDGDGVAWYDPTSDWHAGEHEWHDLGVITLRSVLSDDACERLAFNTDNAPSSLGIPASQSVFDPRSIADSERRVMRRVQAVRTWLVTVLGPPRTLQTPVK